MRTLYKVSRKKWKTLLFVEHRRRNIVQKVQKTLFTCILCELCTKSQKKHEQNTVFSDFFGNVVQIAQKNTVFLHFMRTLYELSQKSQKTVFSHVLRNIVQKVQKTPFFAFYANFVQSVTKNVKKQCFLTRFAERRAKCSKEAVFMHSMRTFFKVSRKKVNKTLFSNTFWRTSCKQHKKTLFSCI